ncbi:MAG: DUF5690 family protein [Planctomycetota bacterium]|nr:DUF5690 family protein [Planctomycetota bacterium]
MTKDTTPQGTPGETWPTLQPSHTPPNGATPAPRSVSRDAFWATWSILAAFVTYFAMYGFRKPFTAASFDEEFFGYGFKIIVVVAQVLGYTLSKFIGIKVIAEMPPARRAIAIIVLIGIAQGALVLFGVVPRPWNAACLFLNGLPLGMVFGLVLGFLEGRRLTELLTAGLCASFILADGVTKSLGSWLLKSGVAEDWMPALAGLISAPALAVGVVMLRRIPRPTEADEAARSARTVMTKHERRALFMRYAVAIVPLVAMYLALTVLRSMRADFMPELWKALGVESTPGVFTRTEMLVAAVVLVLNGAIVVMKDNRLAFFTSLGMCLVGFAVLGALFLAHRAGAIGAYWYMVLMGLGLYLPYVAMHTTVFERMLAMTREKGNLGFLMYLADAFGYLGYVLVLLGKNLVNRGSNVLEFFTSASVVMLSVCVVGVVVAWAFFLRRRAGDATALAEASAARSV